MLYKKYHRSYIRQFKKGTVFKYNYSPTIYPVIDEPIIVGNKLRSISIKCWDNKNFSYTFITLILCTGRFTGIVDKRILIM